MINLTKLLWRITPNFMHYWLRSLFFILKLAPNVWYDAVRFYRYSGINKSRQFQGEQAARITMTYHQLEKGLSYAQPRPGFGPEVVTRLLTFVEPYINQYGLVAPATTAIGVLNAYIAFNESVQVDMTVLKVRVANLSQHLLSSSNISHEGGIVAISRETLEADRAAGFKTFFNSRYSIRHFAGGEICNKDIQEAIGVAQKTPSVCNRQSWKVHVYSNKQHIQQLLSIQNGSRGFGEQASVVLMVTSDLSSFVDVSERYQAWIDGGMFSMSVCLALHAQGLGTCCLNWSKLKADDMAMRGVANIKPQEQIMMLIAVGTLPKQFNVAYSARKSIDEVLQFH